jgi:hypothetical protein
LCTGSNYRDHLEERVAASGGLNAPPKELEFFVKAGQTIAALDAPLRLDPAFGLKIDQETELGIVMRPGCVRKIPEERARSYIFGYLVVNDLTAREKQVEVLPDGSNFMLGASKKFRQLDPALKLRRDSGGSRGHRQYPDQNPLERPADAKQFHKESDQLPRARDFVLLRGSNVTARRHHLRRTPGGTGWGEDREL